MPHVQMHVLFVGQHRIIVYWNKAFVHEFGERVVFRSIPSRIYVYLDKVKTAHATNEQ